MLDERRDKVLVVDDDPSRRHLVCRHLSSAHYWVLEANRLENLDPLWDEDEERIPSVRELLKAHFFHGAVIDLSFKRLDSSDRTGFEILAAIHNRKEGTKCIILTGYGATQDVRDSLLVFGAYDFLDKDDYSKNTLVELVVNAVAQARVRPELIPGDKLTYYMLVPADYRSEVRERLHVRGDEVIRSVVEEALRPYSPYDPMFLGAVFENVAFKDALYSFLVLKMWSRYLGSGIELRVGAREACHSRASALSSEGGQEGADFVVFEYDRKDAVVGLVEHVPTMTPDEFVPSEMEQGRLVQQYARFADNPD